MILNIKSSDFQGSYLKSFPNNIVIILFKMDNCKYCNEFLPTYEKLSTQYKNKIIFTSIDRGSETELINDLNSNIYGYEIKSYPTIVIYNQGIYLTTYQEDRNYNIISMFLQNILNYNNTNTNINNKKGKGLKPDEIKLAIIVPDSKYNHIFYEYIYKLLITNNINYFHIFIIKSDNKNIGELYNIGFDYIQSYNEFNTFIFHESNILPKDNLGQYYNIYPINPIHISYNNTKSLDGIISFNKEDFIKINGYPNNIKDEKEIGKTLYKKLKMNNITYLYPNKTNIQTNIQKIKRIYDNSGLSDIKYKVKKIIKFNKYTTQIVI
jgi:thiol-disulfide isomerase/thioredoxin